MKNFSNKIKKLRLITGLTQEKFAAMYKIPLRTYSDWERGMSTPPEYLVDLLEESVRRRYRSYGTGKCYLVAHNLKRNNSLVFETEHSERLNHLVAYLQDEVEGKDMEIVVLERHPYNHYENFGDLSFCNSGLDITRAVLRKILHRQSKWQK